MVCGKRSGKSFKEAVRVDSENKCTKEGYVKCGANRNPENTICVEKERDCPINFMKWAKNGKELYDILEKEGWTSEDVTISEIEIANLSGMLVFSKKADSLPITSIKMLEDTPCLNPW